jgi:hypothetical protein
MFGLQYLQSKLILFFDYHSNSGALFNNSTQTQGYKDLLPAKSKYRVNLLPAFEW